jgi:hypothetical protein
MCMPRCPQWTLSSVVLVAVYCVLVPNACYCLCAVDVWLSVRPRYGLLFLLLMRCLDVTFLDVPRGFLFA